ncbi:MAG: hypothetical protein JRF33_18580 [Deltaproteobacteria bacterium]|nr:hypothetical protein [Deltaproteobacteria bacterium]
MDFKVEKVEVDDQALEAFDQIMHCGSRGVHLLFSHDQIRRAFVRRDAMLALEDAESGMHLQEAIENLVTIEHVDEQQEFIDALDPEVCDLLVHLYFGFLDRYLNSDGEEVPEVLH